MNRDFGELMRGAWAEGKFLCVGLDPVFDKLPEHLKEFSVREAFVVFCREIVDATKDIAGFYKPNTAFFEAHGDMGMAALREITAYIKEQAPKAAIICDAKRADIGSTNEGYVQAVFDHLGMDAVTVHPYLGGEAIAPFLAQKNKGIFILARTSNPGAGEIQDVTVGGEPLYMHVAKTAATKWNTNGNVGLVTGATYPEEIAAIREAVNVPFLIPGVGAQGGDLEKAVRAAKTLEGGFILTIGRSIMYAGAGRDYAAAAQKAAAQFDSAIRAAML